MSIFLCYDPPREVGRTGHVVIVVVDDPSGKFNPEKIIFCYSLYHDLLPSVVRGMAKSEQIFHGMGSYAITSDDAEAFKIDQEMRGKSWYVMALGKDEKNALQDVVKLVSLFSPKKKTAFFNDERCDHSVTLSESLQTLLQLAETVSIKAVVNAALALNPVEMEDFLNDEKYKCVVKLPKPLQALFREDVSVPDLVEEVKALPQQKRKEFLETGKYQFVVKLPDSFDDKTLIAEIKKLHFAAKWAMYAPFLRLLIPGEGNSYNCCSLVHSALEKSDTRRSEPLEIFKELLWAAYVVLLAWQWTCRSEQCSGFTSNLLLLPLLSVLNNARLYAKDMAMMATKKTPFYAAPIACVVMMMVNMFGLLFGRSNAMNDVFNFPSALFREVRNLPGSVVYKKDAKGDYKVQPKSVAVMLGLG